MKIKRFASVDNLDFNLESFITKSKILLITGLSGSGKSYLAKEMANKYNATVFQVEWLKHKKHISDDCKYILETFMEKYPEAIPYINTKWNNCKCEDDNELFKKYINLFFLHFLEVKDNNKNYIVEGIQLFTLLDFNLIKDYPLIIKGTSAYKSFKNRLKRDYERRKSEKFIVKVKFLFRVFKESFTYQGKHVKKLNNFIIKKENYNAQ